MYRLIFILSLILLIRAGNSQDFKTVDQGTYDLYMEKQWDELIRAGKVGLKQDIDYYYLRMRIGIAYYEKKNYRACQAHFRKALEFNQGDPLASEYLYYAYLFAGQTQQAGILSKDFSPSLTEKIIPPPGKIVDRLAIEYLYNFNDTKDLVSDPGQYFSGLPAGHQLVTLNYSNVNAMLHHEFSPGITLTQAYTYLNKTNYYYYNDGLAPFGFDEQKVFQNQYFISLAFTTKWGLTIAPSFHYLRIRSRLPYVVSGGGGAGPGGGWSSIQYSDQFANHYVAGLSLKQSVGRFGIRLGGVYSSMNNSNQLTGTAGLTWYPLGNLDLYMGTALNVHSGISEHTISTDHGTRIELIPEILIGFGIASRVWMEFSGSHGDMKNYTEGNGYIVYNGPDWMIYKAMGTIVIPITEKGSNVYLGTRFAEYKSQFILRDLPFDVTSGNDINNIISNSISIFGGLSWKF
jgi:hypothetical protein